MECIGSVKCTFWNKIVPLGIKVSPLVSLTFHSIRVHSKYVFLFLGHIIAHFIIRSWYCKSKYHPTHLDLIHCDDHSIKLHSHPKGCHIAEHLICILQSIYACSSSCWLIITWFCHVEMPFLKVIIILEKRVSSIHLLPIDKAPSQQLLSNNMRVLDTCFSTGDLSIQPFVYLDITGATQ